MIFVSWIHLLGPKLFKRTFCILHFVDGGRPIGRCRAVTHLMASVNAAPPFLYKYRHFAIGFLTQENRSPS